MCQSLGKPHVHTETIPKKMTVQTNVNMIVRGLGCFIIKVNLSRFSSIFTNVNMKIKLINHFKSNQAKSNHYVFTAFSGGKPFGLFIPKRLIFLKDLFHISTDAK